MDISKALDFARTHSQAVLATTRRDGRPQLTPVNVAVDDSDRLVISSREPAYKVRNARRDPRVHLLVMSDGFYGEWVQVEGTADVQSLPDALEPLVDYYRRVSGEHPDWEDYRAAMVRDQRCLIRVTPTAAGPDREG
jgi:PPOX class probable F420-dependent enzyme